MATDVMTDLEPPANAVAKAPAKPAPTPAPALPPAPDPFLLKDLKTGAADKRGRIVTDIFWAVPDFKVYATAKGISPQFSDDPALAKQQRANYMALGPELSDVNQAINLMDSGWNRFTSKLFSKLDLGDDPRQGYYEREIARAIAQALSDDVEEARKTLQSVDATVSKRMANVMRVFYFSICVAATLIVTMALSGYASTIANPQSEEILGLNAFQLCVAAIMGSLGALLSTAIGLRSLSIDPMATLTINITYAFQRMLVGILGAVVIHITLKSGLFNSLLGANMPTSPDTAVMTYKLAFISLLAGFSERLVPNLLDRASQKFENQEKPAAGTDPATPTAPNVPKA